MAKKKNKPAYQDAWDQVLDVIDGVVSNLNFDEYDKFLGLMEADLVGRKDGLECDRKNAESD